MEYLTEGYRLDGRRPNEFRKLECRLAPFRQADGSAYLSQGGTKVLAAVYGPYEPRNEVNRDGQCSINVEYARATFATLEHRNRARGDKRSQDISQRIKAALESAVVTSVYTRSTIDVYLQVIESDGADWSACINCAGLAMTIILKKLKKVY